MSASRMTIPPSVALALVLGLSMPVLGPGCGPAAPELDTSTDYTPESLAQELAFRFRALSPESKKSTRKPVRRSKSDKSVADLEQSEITSKKGQGAPVTKKRSGPPTLDDLLDDVALKLEKIKGTPRAESYQKLIDAISKDSSLNQADRKVLSEKIQQLSEAH